LAGAAGWAQQSQKPVAPATVSTDLAITFAGERSQALPGQTSFWFKGGGADAAVTFKNGLGFAASLTGDHVSNITPYVDANKITILAGPRYTWTAWRGHASAADNHRLQIFGQGLFGLTNGFNGLYPAIPVPATSANSLAMQAGGGLNYYLTRNFGLRLLEADYVRTALPNGAANIQNDLRLSAGITWHIASAVPPPVSVACSANPVSIFAGDPVTVTATAGGLNPKLNAVYTWSGSGVSGNGTTATVATAALAPGSYMVKCGVKEGKAGKEGLKPWEAAEASTSYTVKAFEPPTINCSANPGAIKPGETSTITAAGVSPQNRPLTYSYAATAGTVAGNGASATFSSTGAPTGKASITCNVSDDKGQTATANTSVTILAPYVAPAPAEPPEVKQLEARLALHSVFFPTNLPTAGNPKGGLVASQQGTLTALASDFKKYLVFKPEAQLTLTGHADVRGSVEFNQALSERRVARTKQFLVEQGVSEGKIETRGLGKGENLTAVQVKELVEQNTALSAAELGKVLHDLGVIVWAQNRRVDVTLSTTGQQSVRLYPFNAADALTLIGKKTSAPVKKAAGGAVKKPVAPVKKMPVPPKK
jgi:outer membrane protein OmpA-like peptidoglycan-associated protein